MVRIQELKADKKYKDIFSITHEEYKAMELLVLSDGEIFPPLFVWKGQDILVYGYHYWEIIKAHPEIKYTAVQLEPALIPRLPFRWAVLFVIVEPVPAKIPELPFS